MNQLEKRLIELFGAPSDADAEALLALLRDKEPLLKMGLTYKTPAALLSAPALSALKLGTAATAEEVSAKIVMLGESQGASGELQRRIAQLEEQGLVREVDTAIDTFSIAPAEREGLLKLAKSDVTLFRDIVSKREKRPPGGLRIVTPPAPSGRQVVEKQDVAIKAYLAEPAHKDETYAQAIAALLKSQPALFSDRSGSTGEG